MTLNVCIFARPYFTSIVCVQDVVSEYEYGRIAIAVACAKNASKNVCNGLPRADASRRFQALTKSSKSHLTLACMRPASQPTAAAAAATAATQHIRCLVFFTTPRIEHLAFSIQHSLPPLLIFQSVRKREKSMQKKKEPGADGAGASRGTRADMYGWVRACGCGCG